MKRGATLPELIVATTVTALLVTAAVQVAVLQLRFVRGASDIAALRSQLGGAESIVASLLWPASPAAGDIVVALDSALQLDVTIGAAVVCAAAPARIVVPAATPARGNVLAAYFEAPEPDDRVSVYLADSAGGTWITLHVASPPVGDAGGCGAFPAVTAAWSVDLREAIQVPVGTTVRFLRPLRLSLYRASDDAWYLGAKDWNGASQRFNGIQPVAGPLRAYSPDPSATGLLFQYLDRDGLPIDAAESTARVASIRVVSRGATTRPVRASGLGAGSQGPYGDSVAVRIPLRNAR